MGSVLLWRSREMLKAERTIADLEIGPTKYDYPVNYLLDGQQRLSSVCGALYWKGDDPDSQWNIDDNHFLKGRTAMSSLAHNRADAIFVMESGVSAWEDPEPVADWNKKTVSVVSGQLSAAVELLWLIIRSRPPSFERVLRLYLAPLAPAMTASQERRLMAQLKTDPPGFTETTIAIAGAHACVTSVLDDPSAVEAGFLSSYRSCALIEIKDTVRHNIDRLRNACSIITDLGSSGIAALLNEDQGLAVLRLLELESYTVIQLIGSPMVSQLAVQCLLEQGVQQCHDIRALPHELARLC